MNKLKTLLKEYYADSNMCDAESEAFCNVLVEELLKAAPKKKPLALFNLVVYHENWTFEPECPSPPKFVIEAIAAANLAIGW